MLLSRIKVLGHSMMPTLSPKQEVVVSSVPYIFSKPKVGDVILLKHPKQKTFLIKRITSKKGSKYMVLGDNEKDSLDSTDFGLIERKHILAKVIITL
jgi:nickel-type superoxide dismutase maturation protease